MKNILLKTALSAVGISLCLNAMETIPAYGVINQGIIRFSSNRNFGFGTSSGTFAYDTDSPLITQNLPQDQYFEVTAFEATVPTGEVFRLSDFDINQQGDPTVLTNLGFNPEGRYFGIPLVSGNGIIASRFIDTETGFALNLFLGSPGEQAGYEIAPDLDFFPPSLDLGNYVADPIPTSVPEPGILLGILSIASVSYGIKRKLDHNEVA